MKTHLQTLRSASRAPSRLRWLLLIPLLATSLPAQPTLNIEDGAVLNWPVSDTNYIVQWSPTPEGPWTCSLDPIATGPDGYQVAVRTRDAARYFRLAQGYRIEDDFNDGEVAGWTVFGPDPEFLGIVSLDATNGQLRIHGNYNGDRHAYCFNTNVVMADYAASIDILNWADGTDSEPLFALVARAEPGVLNTNMAHYLGGATVKQTVSPPQSSLWIYKWVSPGAGGPAPVLVSQLTPTKDYRLVFRIVGGQSTAELYDLADLTTPIAQITGTDPSPLPPGWAGVMVNDRGVSGTLDVTLDNFVAVGTTP